MRTRTRLVHSSSGRTGKGSLGIGVTTDGSETATNSRIDRPPEYRSPTTHGAGSSRRTGMNYKDSQSDFHVWT